MVLPNTCKYNYGSVFLENQPILTALNNQELLCSAGQEVLEKTAWAWLLTSPINYTTLEKLLDLPVVVFSSVKWDDRLYTSGL